MKILKISVLAMLFSLGISSCAVMFNGTKKAVSIKTITPDSKIYVDGDYIGNNFVRTKLKRKEDHTIMVKKEGCQTRTANVESEIQAGWIVFDALFNWFAFLTDAPTGAWYGFDKSKYVFDLECK